MSVAVGNMFRQNFTAAQKAALEFSNIKLRQTCIAPLDDAGMDVEY